jgi:hypothetical protein
MTHPITFVFEFILFANVLSDLVASEDWRRVVID